MEMKLELVMVPVTDVDRAKEFYVQLTPPGSGCSIAVGKGLTEMAPGSLDNLQMVVADADAAHADLVGRGIDVSPVEDLPWGRFVRFADPDGNRWSLQQLPVWS